MANGSLDAELLRPSGAMLAAQIALGAVIERDAMAGIEIDQTVLDLLVRIDLAPAKRLRAVDICRQLQMSASHISRVIDRAESEGLVERSPDPADRRASLVSITASGRAVVAKFAPRLHAVLDHVIFDVLDSDEINTLVELLQRIEQAARSIEPHPH
jgi:DNA-binding MarR family transcriptional regulator